MTTTTLTAQPGPAAPAPADDATLRIDDATADLLFRDAHTAHAYTGTEVGDARLRAAYDLVRYGPSALNSNPLRLLLVDSAAGRERLAAAMFDSNKPKVLAAPRVLVAAFDVDFHEHLDRLAPFSPGASDRMAARGADDRAAVARTSALLQAGYLIVGLRAAGLDVGPMTGYDADAVDADLLAGTAWRSFLVLTVGEAAPEGVFPRQPRLEWDEVTLAV